MQCGERAALAGPPRLAASADPTTRGGNPPSSSAAGAAARGGFVFRASAGDAVRRGGRVTRRRRAARSGVGRVGGAATPRSPLSSRAWAWQLPRRLHSRKGRHADDTGIINFLLQSEIIPLCLQIMETGSELSKMVSTFIIEKILQNDVGLQHVCATADRFFNVAIVLATMVAALVDQPSTRVLKHVIHCYLNLTDDPRARIALQTNLPEALKDGTFDNCLRGDPATRQSLQQLLNKLASGGAGGASRPGPSHAAGGSAGVLPYPGPGHAAGGSAGASQAGPSRSQGL